MSGASPVVGSVGVYPIGGFQRVKHLVCAYLENNLNPTSAAIRTIYNLPAPTAQFDPLPDVSVFLPNEPPALDAGNLPAPFSEAATALLYVSCTQTINMEMVDISERGDPYYDVTYPVNVLTWVKGFAWDDTIRSRDNLATAVKATLLRDFTIGTTIRTMQSGVSLPNGNSAARWDPNSYRSRADAWEVQVARGNRHIGGVQTSFNVTVRETITVPPLGVISTAEDIVLDLALLPFQNGLSGYPPLQPQRTIPED